MNETTPAGGQAFRLDRWVNLYELIFDIIIAGIAGFFYRLAAPDTGFILIDTGPLPMLCVMAGAEFFIMLFFGQVYRRYNDIILKPPRIVDALSGIILFIAINGIFFMMPAVLASALHGLPEIGENIEFAFVPISGAFIILGITFGFPRKSLKDIEPLASLPIAITGILGVVSVLFVIFSYGIVLGILYFIFVGGALLTNRLIFMRPEPEEAKQQTPASSPWRIIAGILLPIAAAFALTVWQELVTVRAVSNTIAAGETITPWNIILIMTVSGLIPVRILTILAPPFRPVNAGLAVLTMQFYFSSVAGAIDKLMAFK